MNSMSHSLTVVSSDGKELQAELSFITLMFFDTVIMELQRDFGRISFFEYEDEDGDRISVRSDDDMDAFRRSLLTSETSKIWIRQTSQDSLLVSLILPSDLKFLDVIANGQFGTVFRSLHIPSDQVVAVKSLEVDTKNDRRDDILQELMLVRKCEQSEFVVDLLGASLDSNSLLICFEYMDGGAIANYGALPPIILSHVARSLIEGLQYLWDLNIIHRDLKPSNVLVNMAGFVKLSDFGVSKQMEMSIARSFVGTSVYMAPERIRGQPYGRASDVWSLGLTLWELLLGVFPLHNESDSCPTSCLGKIVTEDVIVTRAVDGYDETIWNVLEGCLKRDVALRWKLDEVRIGCIARAWPIDRQLIGNFVSLSLKMK